jgi:hypothetical protein
MPLAVIPVVQFYPPSPDKNRPPLTKRSISEGLARLVVVIPYSSITTL